MIPIVPFIRQVHRQPGSGKDNTVTILNQEGHTASAAGHCTIWSDGGFNDWFLPSIESLIQIYNVLEVPGLRDFPDEVYWSSTEKTETTASVLYFSSGSEAYSSKGGTARVIAVREVAD